MIATTASPVIGLPRRPGLSWAASLADAATGLGRLEQIYAKRQSGLSPHDFVRFANRELGIGWTLDEGSLEDIPATGPTLIVANHPLGAPEGLLLADLLLTRRPDVRLFANVLLTAIPELAPLVIPVDVFRTGVNQRGVRDALRHLKQGGALIVFPAGEVSRLDWSERAIVDPPWNPTAAVLARRSGARVVPIFVDGRPRKRSVAAGVVHPRLRTLLLARDLLALRGHGVGFRIGGGIEGRELERLPEPARTPYLRMLTYSLGEKGAAVSERPLAPVAPAVPKDRLASAVAGLPAQRHLFAHGDMDVYLAPAAEMSPVMDEIARLRELSFREVGEGTGHPSDTDLYDRHYQHLFVWHRDRHEIVGAYRLGFCDEIVARHGVGGLYTHTLFDFDDALFRRLGPSIELGRSFVSPAWQRSFNPLRMLWGGIASICASRPRIRFLFGPVSISPSYSTTGRALMADVLTRHYSDPELQALARPRNPPRRKRAPDSHRNVVSALADASLLSRVVARVENGPGLPVLVRQYLELNGRFASFNVDDAFGGTLDGLVFVEVARIPPHIFARYLKAGSGGEAQEPGR